MTSMKITKELSLYALKRVSHLLFFFQFSFTAVDISQMCKNVTYNMQFIHTGFMMTAVRAWNKLIHFTLFPIKITFYCLHPAE